MSAEKGHFEALLGPSFFFAIVPLKRIQSMLILFDASMWLLQDVGAAQRVSEIGCTPRVLSCNNTLLRRIFRRLFRSKCFLERVLRRRL